LAGYDLEIAKDRIGDRLCCEVQVLVRPGKTETAGNGAWVPQSGSPPPEDRRGAVTPKGH